MRDRRVVGACIALALPLIVGLIAVANRSWHPTGDYAHTALAIRDVTNHPPLIGVAGRFGPFDNQHAHLGPAMAYLLWPVTTVLGGSGTALLIATTLLHLAALSAAVLISRRIAGTGLALAIAASGLVLVDALGAQFFLTPWNPWMPVGAFFLFLVLIAGVCCGHLGYAPWAVFVGTFCAQTHISYMILVHGLLGAATLFTAWRWWHTRNSPLTLPWVQPAKWSALVAVVMWLPPLYDQWRRTHNLSWVIGRFAHPCDPRWWGTECANAVGLRAGAKALVSELTLSGAWITGARHDPATTGPHPLLVVFTVVALSVAITAAWRGRDRASLSLLGVASVAALLGLVSAARILGDFYDYVIRWTWPIAAIGAAAVMFSLWRAIPAGNARNRASGFVAAFTIAAVSLSATISAWSVDPPYDSDSRSVGALSGQVARKLSPETKYLLRWHDPAGLGGIGFGLMLDLERNGFTVGTDSWTRYAVGQHRVIAENEAGAVLYIVVGEPSINAFGSRTDDELLANFDPRSPANKIRSDAARSTIESSLLALGRTDLLQRIDDQFGNAALIAAEAKLPDELNAAISIYTDLRLPVALFQVPAGAPAFAP